MPIKASGAISLGDIRNHLQIGSGPVSLGDLYRGKKTPNITENNGVPTSGTIELDDFYGAYGSRTTKWNTSQNFSRKENRTRKTTWTITTTWRVQTSTGSRKTSTSKYKQWTTTWPIYGNKSRTETRSRNETYQITTKWTITTPHSRSTKW